MLSAAALALAACDKAGTADQPTGAALLEPDTAAMKRAAPDSFDVAFETGKGRFVGRLSSPSRWRSPRRRPLARRSRAMWGVGKPSFRIRPR